MIDNIPLYWGARIVANHLSFDHHWVDIQDELYNLQTDQDYTNSCQNMVLALQYLESNLCVSMAYQLAVSLASEIASNVSESPRLHGDELQINSSHKNIRASLWKIQSRHLAKL